MKRHQVCCAGYTCLLLRCATAAAAYLEGLHQAPLAMVLISAPLPCQMELCFVTRLSQRECVGRVLKCARQFCDKGNSCARVQQCQIYVHSNTHPSAWANLAPKVTTTITATEKKTLSQLTSRSFSVSTDPRNMATPPGNTAVAYKSLRMSSTQLRPNRSPTHGERDQLCFLFINSKSLPICCTMLASDQTDRRCILRRHHKNVIICQELRADHKPVHQETNV